MNSDAGSTPNRRALVVIPGTVNYFYNQSGHRIADALRELGFDVDVSTLGQCPEGDYAWCVLSSITEILFGFGDEAAGLEKIRELRRRCGAMSSCGIDCVATPWYHRLHDLTARAGVETIIDLGLHDQSHALVPGHRSMYRFVFSGLTPSERRLLSGLDEDAERTIPWAFVGHNTPHRAALVDHLIQTVDPRGFVYMPTLSVYAETGSPHLNQEQFETVLRHTRYQVWCSHHPHFYMEPERFRTSLLTGGIPVKVVNSRQSDPEDGPARLPDDGSRRRRRAPDARSLRPDPSPVLPGLAAIPDAERGDRAVPRRGRHPPEGPRPRPSDRRGRGHVPLDGADASRGPWPRADPAHPTHRRIGARNRPGVSGNGPKIRPATASGERDGLPGRARDRDRAGDGRVVRRSANPSPRG